MYNLHSSFFQGVPYMHNLILLLFTGCPKHLKPFIFLFTWCTEDILSNCLHGVPNICHLHSSSNMVSQTYIIFLLLLFAWYPKNNRRCYYLHSSFTGCPKHTLSSFFFYRMLKFNKSEGKLIISVKTFKIDIFHETERKQVLWNIVIIEHESYAF